MLTGKIAWVTGASRGVGKGIARELAAQGATVYITARSVDGPNGTIMETAQDIEQQGGQCIPIACDHRQADQIKLAFSQIQQQAGQLDILVNNAWGAMKL